MPREEVCAPFPLVEPRGSGVVRRSAAGGATRSYLAVCGTDRDSDIGSQHDCECRSQFNSESTVEGGREGDRRGQRDSLHCLGRW